MRTAIILRGLPASAKSTYAKELLRKESKRWIRVNRDDIRQQCHDSVFNSDNEELTRKIRDNIILTALREGKDIIIDDTNLVSQTLRKLHRLLESVGDIKVIEKCFNVPIEECKRRNALREGKSRVPDNVIDGMAKGAGIDRGRVLEDKEVYYPAYTQGIYEPNPEHPEAIVVDLDGTLAIKHNGRDYYNASTCDQDLPNTPVIECVKAMYAAGKKIVFMSGREEQYRQPTETFLSKYLPEVMYDGLFMRTTGDSRKDSIVKNELFEANIRDKYYVLFCLDDRRQVVDFYRSLGLAVFQVAPGDF